jgi:hypothetical protein
VDPRTAVFAAVRPTCTSAQERRYTSTEVVLVALRGDDADRFGILRAQHLVDHRRFLLRKDLSVNRAPIEAAADLRVMARRLREMYTALLAEGFTPGEGIQIIGQAISAAFETAAKQAQDRARGDDPH